MIRNVLAIAGSDPSGGAGIQADLKTFGALGCYGMAALTALTVQNTRGVQDVLAVAPEFVAAQIEAVFADIRVDAVKIGMVGTPAVAQAIAGCLRARPGIAIVLDPVLAATSGHSLGGREVAAAIRERLAPLATLLTPNLAEAAILADRTPATSEAEMADTGRALLAFGSAAVLVKGGHLADGTAPDVLCTRDSAETFRGRRIATRNTHGTGCTLSSAIAVFLAEGLPVRDAVSRAKTYVTEALSSADALSVGTGHGPLHHFHTLRRP